MGNVITFFNHKGGVGKTTLVHNVAYALADLKKKVLVIDADPQMNLTSAIYGLSTSVEYSIENDSLWTQNMQKYVSIAEYFGDQLQGESYDKKVFRHSVSSGGCVDMIAGDINLTSLEANIYGIINTTNDFFRDIPGKFERSIRKLADIYDFVLIDTSPSASSIVNALSVFSADYFLAPVSPSFFSLQAIDNLSAIFRKWMDMLGPYANTASMRNGLSLNVKFLGIVVQFAKRYSGGGNGNLDGFAKATRERVDDVNNSVQNFHTFAMRTNNAISKEDFLAIFGEESQPFVIEKCCDFTQKLRTIAEKEGVPVIYLTPEICRKHDAKVDLSKASGQYHKAFENINQQYRNIANNLLHLP